ncbi:solute carrier family 23 (nucleobase transporter), member 1/2, partial [Mytilus galloprovincialis]
DDIERKMFPEDDMSDNSATMTLMEEKDQNGFTPHPEPEGDITIEDEVHVTDDALIYGVTDNPPIHLTILFAFQTALLSLANQLALSIMVAEAVCGETNGMFKTRLLSTTLFMDGITTLMMILFGVRLPLFQGAAFEYTVPLLALQTLDPERCDPQIITESSFYNSTLNISILVNRTTSADDILYGQVQKLEGSLMLAGFLHFLIGATGLVGVLLRFIGPVTIVPTILLIGLYMTRTAVKFISYHWGIGLMTAAISIILSLYLGKYLLPIPVWTRKRGCHTIRYPLHQVFSILIAIMVGWGVSGICTAAGVLSHEKARTDVGIDIVNNASWFYVPHPTQFGPPSFDVSIFVGFFIATIISVLDSIGDYYACAKTCHVPPPPSHAVNRGIAIEGLCTTLSGIMGAGHATSTYGGNIGAIGITKVGSRLVFLVLAIIYIAFGLIGKFSAVFITIPHPVLGGALITMFGMFIGVVLSNLRYVCLSSTRNIAIIGTSILIGLMVPYWAELQGKDLVLTGNFRVDNILKTLLGNANLSGALLACFLDNTIPGTLDERGITSWQNIPSKAQESENLVTDDFKEGIEVYEPLFPQKWRNSKILKYIPFLPDPKKKPVLETVSSVNYEENTRV